MADVADAARLLSRFVGGVVVHAPKIYRESLAERLKLREMATPVAVLLIASKTPVIMKCENSLANSKMVTTLSLWVMCMEFFGIQPSINTLMPSSVVQVAIKKENGG